MTDWVMFPIKFVRLGCIASPQRIQTEGKPGDSSGRGVPNYELRYEKDLPYCEIIVSAKGCGAELPNVAKILTPATLGKNYKGLKQLVLDTICGSNGFMGARGYPCPPFSIGIGLGG